jgi:hypothetical protein
MMGSSATAADTELWVAGGAVRSSSEAKEKMEIAIGDCVVQA